MLTQIVKNNFVFTLLCRIFVENSENSYDMEQLKTLPIGLQDFESLRKSGYLYVDKTELSYNLIVGGKYYFLSRPRRFG